MYGRVRLINIMILLFSTKFIFNYISRLGERCSHVATVLFKIEAAVRNGYTSATSNSCQWNQVFSTKVRLCHVQVYDSDPCTTCIYFWICLQHEPARIIDIDFSCPKHLSAEYSPVTQASKKKRVVTSPTSSEKKAFLTALKTIYPKVVVLTTVFKNETQTSIQTTSTVSRPSR